MKEGTRNTLVGITAIAGLAALGGLVFVFGDMPQWGDQTYPITVDLDTADGIGRGTRVKLNGVDVGEIKSVELKPDPRDGVTLVAAIQNEHEIPAESSVTTSAGLLGGGGSLLITPPARNGADGLTALPRDGSGRLEGEVTSPMAELTSLAKKLGEGMSEPLENLSETSKKVGRLAEEFTEVGRRLNEQLAARTLEEVEAGDAAPNLVTVFARADARLAELKDTLAKINAFVGDEQLIADFKATMANAKDASAGAAELTDEAKKAVAVMQERFDQLARRYIAVADDLSGSLARVDALLAKTQQGEGTLGKLFNDPALYDSFTEAADRLDDSLKEFKLLIQKWKAEGLPVQF